MRLLLLASGIGLMSVVATAPAGAADGHTTVVQDENGTSVITQSGDPASPPSADQSKRFATGELRPVYLHPKDMAGHVARSYHPGS